LKFPHHDNEIAQSEAYFESNDWIKYFLHSGHLTIAGCKMSKSLKNFITIKDALKEYSAAQLRMTFLLHSWKDTLDYSPSGMETAIQMEKTIKEFFLNVKDCLRSSCGSDEFPKWTDVDLKLHENLVLSKQKVHESLCDSVDTRSAMFALKELIGSANKYIQSGKLNASLNGPLLSSIAVYITKMLRVFGVVSSTEKTAFGFGTDAKNQENVNVEDIVLPFVEVLSDFRETVRTTVKGLEAGSIKAEILKACDLIRDEKMPNLGVRLEDQEGSYCFFLPHYHYDSEIYF